MNLIDNTAGMIQVCVISADIAETLRRSGDLGITLYRIQPDSDGMTCRFVIHRKDWARLESVTRNRGDSLELVDSQGIYWNLKALTRRYVLLSGILLLLCVSLFLPGRVILFEVEGNQTVSDIQILAEAEKAGTGFGTSRKALRSEQLKNALLEAIPQLQWVGVNTFGCRAVIAVRERSAGQPAPEKQGVSSVVAARDGVVCQITVERGSGLCKVGQAVKSGQILISGYTDCGLSIQATRAAGEVFADTERKITVLAPSKWDLRGEVTAQNKKLTIIFGKKRINLYQGSGISHTGCVKMYKEYHLTLPGGFRLPVTWVLEEWQCTECTVSSVATEAGSILTDFARTYLSEQMIAGQILSESVSESAGDGVLILRGSYACREMIGQIRSEEIIQ